MHFGEKCCAVYFSWVQCIVNCGHYGEKCDAWLQCSGMVVGYGLVRSAVHRSEKCGAVYFSCVQCGEKCRALP